MSYDYRNEFNRVTVYVTEPQPGGMYPEGKVQVSCPSFSGSAEQAEVLISNLREAIEFAENVVFE